MVIVLNNSINESFDSFLNNTHIEVVNALNECEYIIFGMKYTNEASVEDIKDTVKRTIHFIIGKAQSIIDTFLQNVFEKIDSIKSKLRNVKNGKNHISIIDKDGKVIKSKASGFFDVFKKKAIHASSESDENKAIKDTKNAFEDFKKSIQEIKDNIDKNIRHYKRIMSSPKVNEDGIIDVEWEPV